MLYSLIIYFLFSKLISDFGKLRCNEGIQLQESSKLFQIQCLSESNNNTTDTGKIIQSHLFNNCSQSSASSLVMMEKKNFENFTINNPENAHLHNYKHSQITNNSSFLIGLRPPNEINIENNYLSNAHPSNNIEDDEEDVHTNQSIMSLALKISQQDINFNCPDDFDEHIINNSNSCNLFVEQNGDRNVDPSKVEEEYKITNSLKILESLVNIEHNKLEVQKSLTENESHLGNGSFEKKQSKISYKTHLKKKDHRKSKKKELKSIDKEERITTKEHKSHCFENQSKKRKSRKDKSFRSEATSSSSTNNKTLDITSSVEIPIISQNTKDNLPSNELKTHLDIVGNITVNEKELNNINMVKETNILSINDFPIASTSRYSERDMDNSKNKSSSINESQMKPSDYNQKTYDKYCKSLFSDPIIITSKRSKKDTNNLDMIKEGNLSEKKDDSSSIKESKSQNSKSKFKSSLPNSKKKVSYHDDSKMTTTNGKHKEVVNTKSVLKSSTKSSSNRKLSRDKIGNRNKFKRLKIHEPHDEIKNNSDTNTNILENKNVIIAETFENPELKNNESSIGISEYQHLPKWLRIKCELYEIKPVYIVVDPNKTYS